MGRKKTTSRSGGSVVHISTAEVAGVPALANEGKQQLKIVETDQPTKYYFSVEYRGHHSACEICISPFKLKHHENVHFSPTQRYTICCDHASKDGLQQQRQTVYDALIRPVQWQFGNRSVQVEIPSTPATNAASCKETSFQSVKFLEENEPASVDKFVVVDIAKSASDKVLKALNDVEKPNFAAISYPSNKNIKTNEARLEIADVLWSLAEKQKDGAEVILWANKFYSLCMRYLLRRSGFIKTDGYRDRIAKATALINTVANEFCDLSADKTCFCLSNTVYNGFARARYLLPDIPGSDGARLAVAKEITVTLRAEKLPVLADQFIFHAPAVISYLWNEDYTTVCTQLGVDGLAQHDMTNQVGKIGDAELYTYAVHCACPCGRATPTYEARHNNLLIADRHASSYMVGDPIRGSNSRVVSSVTQNTSTEGIREGSVSDMNKRPAIQQQYNDTTKRQRVVPEHAHNKSQLFAPTSHQNMNNDTNNDSNTPTNSSTLGPSAPDRTNATYADIESVTEKRVGETQSAGTIMTATETSYVESETLPPLVGAFGSLDASSTSNLHWGPQSNTPASTTDGCDVGTGLPPMDWQQWDNFNFDLPTSGVDSLQGTNDIGLNTISDVNASLPTIDSTADLNF